MFQFKRRESLFSCLRLLSVQLIIYGIHFNSEVYRYSEFRGVIIGGSEFSFDPLFGMLIIECCCWLLLNSYRGNCTHRPIVVLILGSDFHLSLFLRNEQGFVTKRKVVYEIISLVYLLPWRPRQLGFLTFFLKWWILGLQMISLSMALL